jgi:lipoprotein-anchoring transpeptidase ErfK/SrfK
MTRDAEAGNPIHGLSAKPSPESVILRRFVVKRRQRRTVVVIAGLLAALALSPGAHAEVPRSFPAAGEILPDVLVVRSAPNGGAPVVKRLRSVRRDLRLQIVHAVRAAKDANGDDWLKLRLPMRPNGTTGWARAEDVLVRPVPQKIVIDLSARSLKLYRKGRLLASTRKVGIGKRGTPTPRGYFYVTAKYRAPGRGYGVFALETSAYSPTLSDWPGGGVVGIHGTFQPQILPGAVSHGCVRVTNRIILRLKRLAPVGTAIRVVR